MRLFLNDPLWTRVRVPGTTAVAAPDLAVRRFTLTLPAPLARPFRLALFSDLHWYGEREQRLRQLIETVNAAAVDVVLFGGDLAAHLQEVPEALRRLAGLTARCACIAVRGNRESACGWLDRRFWQDRYSRAGFRYLENEAWVSPDDPAAPAIVGVDDARHGRPDFGPAAAAAATGRTVVTLTHNPDAVGHRDGTFLGHLVLSGHTHGGQLRLPWLGAVFTSSLYWRQFDLGWRRHRRNTLLYVTAGSGETGFPLLRRRVLCPPEVVLITLAASPAAAASSGGCP